MLRLCVFAVTAFTVAAVHGASGDTYLALTNETRNYNTQFVRAGTYNLSAEKPAFQRLEKTDIVVGHNEVIRMPSLNAIEAIIGIRSEFPNARVIVLTTYAGDVQVLRALKAGARGYILKAHARSELLDSIRAVHAGQKRIPPEVAAELAEYATQDDARSMCSA
jgi:DNA-binding NarL/FixJ family response regulator